MAAHASSPSEMLFKPIDRRGNPRGAHFLNLETTRTSTRTTRKQIPDAHECVREQYEEECRYKLEYCSPLSKWFNPTQTEAL
jgi:hypothetical protein